MTVWKHGLWGSCSREIRVDMHEHVHGHMYERIYTPSLQRMNTNMYMNTCVYFAALDCQ